MAWRDTLRTASFRGVQFKVDGHEYAGGRRTVQHNYPLRDDAYVEDMGKRAPTFTLDAYVIGADYTPQRDALLTALEKPGAGELVHPYLGAKRVVCTDVRFRETKDEGGMVRFQLTFVETLQPIYPDDSGDGAALISDAADAAQDAAGEEFTDTFSAESMPQWALDTAADLVRAASESMEALMAPLALGIETRAALKQKIDNLYLDADSLVRSPADLLESVVDSVQSLARLPALPSQSGATRRALDAMRALYSDTEADDVTESTATREQQQANNQALVALVRRTSALEAARLAPDAEFDSYDDAKAVRDDLADLLDEQAEAASDSLYQALMQTRAELVKAVPGDDNDLARISEYTPPSTVPVLALAYRLYGDAARADDIVTRNGISHPGFVVGGNTLQVLVDA